MALYKYLKTNEIRLLSVRRNEDGSLAGELKTISIEDTSPRYRSREKKLDYFAVSYVWGSRDHDQVIAVDGHELKITLNAHAVLNLFCDWPKQRHRKAWVWVDAVCINQEDVMEKSVQVPLMSSIYGRAKRAVVWLGESSDVTDQGMDLMRTLAMGKKGYPVPHSVLKSSEAWAGFEEIASRPWWRRAWTLQESAIPSDTVYYCGNKSLAADEVRSAVLVVSSYSYTQAQVQLSKATWSPLWHRRRIYQWLGHQDMDDDFDGYERRRPTSGRTLGQIGLPALLAYQRHSLSTNPKDYLYSLLGCIKDKDKQLVGPPAYDSSTEEVYRNLVRNWVLAYQSLDIIAFAELFQGQLAEQDPMAPLPSWTPDWSARLEMASEESNAVPLLVSQPNKADIGSMLPPRFMRRSEGNKYYGDDSRDKLPLYAAAGKMAMRVSFSKDVTSLTCTGIIIDTVDGISGVYGDDSQPIEQSTSPTNLGTTDGFSAEHMDVALHVMLSLYFGRADVYLQYEAHAGNILAEADLALTGQVEDDITEFAGWAYHNASLKIRGVDMYDALTYTPPVVEASEAEDAEPVERGEVRHEQPRSPQRRSPSPVSVNSNESDRSEKQPEEEEASTHPLPRKFRTATHPNWMARRLAVTNNGYVGMVPKTARKNDVVCVLFGCSVPMLLRPVNDGKYEVIGECYLHGFMEGQVVDKEYEAVNLTLV